MKFATLVTGGRPFVALVSPNADRYWPIEALLEREVGDMTAFISMYDEVKGRLRPLGDGASMGEVQVGAAIIPRRNVMCVGKNYHAHAKEFTKSGFDSSAADEASAVPQAPIVFTKAPETVVATGAGIRYPKGVSDSLDYEAELGVVIGKGGRSIRPEQALEHVFGYTIINDVTARDLQLRHKQWFLGKSLDTFCPMGPFLVTRDEVDVSNLQVSCWVNGELRQDANTADLIFDVPTLIATLSAGMQLNPGDVIATGTPAGVGIGFNPPKYLQVGDEVKIEISGLGRLTNKVV